MKEETANPDPWFLHKHLLQLSMNVHSSNHHFQRLEPVKWFLIIVPVKFNEKHTIISGTMSLTGFVWAFCFFFDQNELSELGSKDNMTVNRTNIENTIIRSVQPVDRKETDEIDVFSWAISEIEKRGEYIISLPPRIWKWWVWFINSNVKYLSFSVHIPRRVST